MENERNSLKSKLEHELGIHDEWAKVVDTCTTKHVEGKNYEFCFFGGIKQDGILLGRYSSWTFKKDPRTDFNIDHVHDISKFDEMDIFGEMQYDYGTRCWNGQDRYVKVTVKCGVDFEILHVEEPSMCTYAMTVSNAAACPHPKEYINLSPITSFEEKDEL